MMLAERAMAPVSAAPCSEQKNPPESTTTCAYAYCLEDVNVYQMGNGQHVCTKHLTEMVSLACDVWPDLVSYTAEFERVLM